MKQNSSFWWGFYLFLSFISFLFSECVAVLIDIFSILDVSIFLTLNLFMPLFMFLTLLTYKIYYWSKSKKRTFWLFAYPVLLVLPFALFGFFVEGSEAYIVKDLSISWTFYVLFTNLMVVLFLPKKITKRKGDIYFWIGLLGCIMYIIYVVRIYCM